MEAVQLWALFKQTATEGGNSIRYESLFLRKTTTKARGVLGLSPPIGSNLNPSIFQVHSLAEVEGISSFFSAEFIPLLRK